MMLPDYITAYLDEQGVPTDDPLATFAALRLDALAPVEMAMLIADPHSTEIADSVYEAWETLADVAETARGFEGVVG